MTLLALPAPVYVAFGVLSSFGALVVARYTLALAKHVRSLARSVARANEGLQATAADVREEVVRAQGTIDRMKERRPLRRARSR